MKYNVTYPEFVQALIKPGTQILEIMTPARANLLHMTIGVSGEAGELLDAIKKHVIYNKPLDLENVTEELGDLRFYITGLMDQLGINESYVELKNMEKLSVRYSKLIYSDKDAQDRNDKN